MAIRAIQAVWRGRWRWSTRTVAVVLCGLGVVSCAELHEVQSDMIRLRADLQAHQAALAALAQRVETVERQVVAADKAGAHPSQEVQQAVEILLKKALEIDTRMAQLETAQVASRRSERPPQPSPQPPQEARSEAVNERRELNLGMTQEEVRRLFGAPLRTEYAGPYIFWQYAPLRDQKYVVFDREGGRVSGWRGL
ncbi:MAG TPA: hypothetical protein VNP04_31605 [Alphaproteobacteria bacterium]|nr:hypothetical protein [Alphaproteobacteria bacterium]